MSRHPTNGNAPGRGKTKGRYDIPKAQENMKCKLILHHPSKELEQVAA
jgi:hypothetical protein